MQQTYALSGMHCQGCVRKVQETLGKVSDKAEVDLATASARLTNPHATLVEMNARLAEIGAYTLSPVLPAQDQPVQAAVADTGNVAGLARYYPLLLIGGYLTVASFAHAQTVDDWMRHFMAGFFLVFSFFKLLNVRAFADSYAMYDLIAGKWRGYGLVYPFIELVLGIACLFAWQMPLVLWATLAVTVVSGIGVARSMLRRQSIRCACLGAVLNVPVSTVTLIEDFGMAAMAIAMLVW
jgi:copper chaperone CopZ